jgi:hypothetical protein
MITRCVRTIMWLGKIETITCNEHSFAWSGQIPCTGMRRCIYCGVYEHDLIEQAKNSKQSLYSRVIEFFVGLFKKKGNHGNRRSVGNSL